jgi:hypothetical protein
LAHAFVAKAVMGIPTTKMLKVRLNFLLQYNERPAAWNGPSALLAR